MADVFTDTVQLANLVQNAYDRYVEFALRTVPVFRNIADKRPVQQAMPGDAVTFQLYNDLATATATLTQDSDVSAVGIPETTTVSVTLAEQGNVVLRTRLLQLESLSDVDPAIANIVAYNMANSLDMIVQNVLTGATQVAAEEGGNLSFAGVAGSVTATDLIQSRDVRQIAAKLRTAAAVPNAGGDLYTCFIHPEVSVDLRQQVGNAPWRDPQVYSGDNASAVFRGEIGTYEGLSFIETPRCPNTDTGSGGTRVFRTFVTARQALAEAVAQEPGIVFGPIVDRFMRFRPVGWYGVIGWNLYRSAALWQLLTTASGQTT